MDVCEIIVPSRHGRTINYHRAASPPGRLLEGEERWEAPDHPQVSSLKIRVETTHIVLSPVKFEPLTTLLRWYFIDLTEASQRPPKDGALGGINFHSIPSADKKPAKLSSESSISFRNLLSSLLAPTKNQGRTQNSVASSITSNSNVSNFRLPKLSIPQFNGHFKDWINFKDLFVSTVHSQVSISNVEKFQYLKGLLTNEPASLIKHMPISNDSYEEAWQKLLDSDECLRGLNALGEQASSKDCWLIYLLLQKIDPESRRLWAIKSSEEEFPNMKAFLDFLNVRCSSLELMSNNESECKIPIRSQTKGCVDLVIGSQSSNDRLEVNAFILNKVTSQIPSEFLDVKDLDYLKSIPLSDEEFMSPKECDIILGSDCFFDILRSGKIVGSNNEPIAQRTMFGWVVAGKLNVKNKEPHELYSHFLSTANELNTDSLLQRFWETEELSVKKQFLSDEEQFCENHFKSNFKYNDEGRFVVKLPIYRDTSRLGNTKGIAISRLLAMERRFQVDKDFERQYKSL
ncbi:DUF1758 domain-containing protein [Trichonephila clavipes]|nr:DUF1758 domain-containing protein [Trichonephila clavipes]